MLMKSKKLLYQNLDRIKEQPEISAAQEEYLRKCRQDKWIVRIWQWVIMVLFIGLWELGARVGFINAFVFSSPSRVAETIVAMATPLTPMWKKTISTRLSATLTSPERARIKSGLFVSPVALTIAAPKL